MKLLPDSGRVLRRAWSVRLIVLAAIFSALPVFMALTSASMLGVPPMLFAGLSALASVAAFVARFMVQPESSQ